SGGGRLSVSRLHPYPLRGGGGISSSSRWHRHPRRSCSYYNYYRSSSTKSESSSSSSIENENEDAATAPAPALAWPTSLVRSTFVNYFADHPNRPHVPYPSSPCVPLNDPTLLFANSGMNQFKPIFLGRAVPGTELSTLDMACNSQKCIRAGGKHNDLDDVGRDTYHHTFFEMLGSWSFNGRYFKGEAIDMAYDLLVNVYGIDPSRLYATYFMGDEMSGLEPDVEARDYWTRYLPENRVIGCPAKDNFWEMGDTGPCGPCSEIHYDRIGDRDASSLVNADDPDVIEIWNLVFIQFNRDETSKLTSLPARHVDTGMGLERLCSLLQGHRSNYDIDVFAPIFDAISNMSPPEVGPYGGLVGDDDVTLRDTAYRAVADHARTLTFALADGAVPDNDGRGYVLRRILRRATRYGQQILKCEPGFFARLVPVVVETFGDAYPELVKNQANIIDIVMEEEQSFSTMLDRGIKYFEDEIKGDGESKKVVSADKAFFLYDTLGFPIDLTELMAQEAGMSIDMEGFEAEMEGQKRRSREARLAAKGMGGKRLELVAEQTSWLADRGIAVTDDSSKYSWEVEVEAVVRAIFTSDGFVKDGDVAKEGDAVGLILDKSSFYAEAGGQEADLGTIAFDGGGELLVNDVQTYGGYALHSGVISGGAVSSGSGVKCKVDYSRRRDVAPNHSMTHVLNAALREVLGEGCDQRGSQCNDEKLRFDFSHKSAMSPAQLRATEVYVRDVIAKGLPVTSEVMRWQGSRGGGSPGGGGGEPGGGPVRRAEASRINGGDVGGQGHSAHYRPDSGCRQEGDGRGTATLESFVAEDTPSLDKEAGALRKDLDASVVSAALKSELRARIESVQKKGIEAKKRLLARRVDKCLNVVKEEVQLALSGGKRSLVLNLDIGADSKASQKSKIAPELAFMGISEEDAGSGGRVLFFAIVPDALTSETGLRADEWLSDVLDTVGGSGGGKPGSAMGQAPRCDDVGEVIVRAESFASGAVAMA
ncbi:hypothetical protein ACHAXA_002185, partial [Cyclostephanos tholiformis]